jgi:hypothetical protein
MTPENLVMHLSEGPEWVSEALKEMTRAIEELWQFVDPHTAERYISTSTIRLAEAITGMGPG